MTRLKSGDLQPLCKMPSPSSFFSRKFCFAALLPARPIDPAPNSPSSLMKKAYLAGVDEEGVVDSSYHALRRPIVRCFVQTRARSWRRRTRDASPIARSGGGAKGNRAKGRKKPARWNRESRDLYLHSRTPLAYMSSFPLQMHSYVKCKVQMHNDWRGFFWSFMHFGKCQVHLHNGWSCSYTIHICMWKL